MKNIAIIISFLLLFYNCKTEISNNKSKQLDLKINNKNIELDSLNIFNFITNKKWVYQQKDKTLSDKTFLINESTLIYDNSIEPILCDVNTIKKIGTNKYEVVVKTECHSKFYFKILDKEKDIVLWEYINLYIGLNEKEQLITKPYSVVYPNDDRK